jgi:hypothetical protein
MSRCERVAVNRWSERPFLRVTSHGSQGTFVELLDLNSGSQVKRAVKERE